MGGIPPELTSAALTALAGSGVWLATWLARKGKREDTKIAESNQSFTQMAAVSEERRKDNDRLTLANADLRAEIERVRSAWESRWERQMMRCRTVNDSLVAAIASFRTAPSGNAAAVADEALQTLERHEEDDHPT